MTHLEIAEQVLQKYGKPLSARAIWQKAVDYGFNMGGKTPWDTMSARLFTDTRDNPNSIFIKLDDKPARFALRTDTPAPIHPIPTNEEDYSTDEQLLNPIVEDIGLIQDKWSVYDHLRKLQRGRLSISNDEEQDFQRNSVWKLAQKSRFIESLLMGFPIPPFYLNLRADGSYLIIDGLQRTITLKEYFNNEFALSELTSLKRYNGCVFTNLPTALQTKLEDVGLNVSILKATTPMRVIYELFDRINTGGTPLTRQEVRNGIYIGASTRLLKQLAEEPFFVQALNGAVSDQRMKDRECVLRYLAFKIMGYEQYKNDISPFLELAMEMMNEMSSLALEKLTNDFKRVMYWAVRLFGETCFRLPSYEEKESIKNRGAFNVSVMESVSIALSGFDDAFLTQNETKIRENYRVLAQNEAYRNAVKNSTGNKKNVQTRFELARQILITNIPL